MLSTLLAVYALYIGHLPLVSSVPTSGSPCGGFLGAICPPGSSCVAIDLLHSECVPNQSNSTIPAEPTCTSTTYKAPASPSQTATSVTTNSTIPPAATAVAVRTGTLYHLSDVYIGYDWLYGFDHQAIPDPTHGRVNYVNESVALAQNLTYTSWDTIIMRADHTTVLDPSGPGRNSVRIQSKKQYTTNVAVIDVRHMPQGCATWPAFWSTSASNWPSEGEIDVIEGVNDEAPNQSTLHTTANCTVTYSSTAQTGAPAGTDCYWEDNYNAGCGVHPDKPNNYGPAFNAAGGGWYVMERTSSSIKMWFWSRSDPSVPPEIKYGQLLVEPEEWGAPYAYFASSSACNFSTHFGPENFIINLTLCGDWAGNAYPSTCPKTCVDHVNQDPADFQDAYWDIASLRIYE